MKKRVDGAPPEDSGDCEPSRGLIDELSTLEAILEQRGKDVDKDAIKNDRERANKDDQRD